MGSTARLCLGALLFGLAACVPAPEIADGGRRVVDAGGDGGVPDGGPPDAAPRPDAEADAGPALDAADGSDAAALDAEAPVDAGAPVDAAEPDLGLADAEPADASEPDASEVDAGGADAAAPDAGACPTLGTPDCPIEIASLPFSDQRDLRTAPSDALEAYACAPATDESGPEFVYRLSLPTRARVVATVSDGAGVDADLHLLAGAADAAACTHRDDTTLDVVLDPGDVYLVVDTWVNAQGQALAGPYTLEVEVFALTPGSCAVQPLDLKMWWADCPTGVSYTCYEAVDPADGRAYRYLVTPAVGPVVKEAHLVTTAESFPSGWPTSFTDGIANHYALSQAATGYVMTRREPWAPAGEGGSEYGQGSTGAKVPVLAEAWYVNMYWRSRPAAGTRLLIRNPANGRAVVAAGGYETGPGANTAIGGVTEEIHHHLGTTHRSPLEIGFLADPTLPLGPIDCVP